MMVGKTATNLATPREQVVAQNPPFGVFAGSGDLPEILCQALVSAGEQVFVFRVVGEASDGLKQYPGIDFRWGEIGNFLRLVREHNIAKLTLAGGISKRPDFSSIRLDTGTLALLPRILSVLTGGDDTLIGRATALLEEKSGLELVSALEIAPSLALERCDEVQAICGKLTDSDREDLEIAIEFLKTAGRFDIGQAVAVINKRIVAVEAAEGTDGMLHRIAQLRDAGRIQSKKKSGILVKAPKPNQDMRFDIPVVGVQTVENVERAGLKSLAIASGSVLLLGRDQVMTCAKGAKLSLLSFPFDVEAGQ